MLVFGLVQSLLDLRKDDASKSKWSLRKIFSAVYISGFIVGVAVIVIQEREADKVNGLIQGISSSVGRIDSVDKRLVGVLAVSDSLVTQYEKVNAKLSRQIELDIKNLEEKSAVVALMDYDLKWLGSDSTSYAVEACIRNFGHRNALITSGHGYVVFFDSDKKPFFHVAIPGNSNKGILEPNDIEQMRLCYYSHGVYDYAEVKAKAIFAIIHLEIHYQDVLMKRPKTEHFYSIWNPKRDAFGGPKDWQVNLAHKWAVENYK